MFESIAYAQSAPAAGQAGGIVQFAPFILIFFVFYFFLIRPQQRKQRELQEMINALKKGDRVITAGGIIGTVTGIQDDYVVIRTGGENEGAKMEVLKSGISGLRQADLKK